MAQAFVPSTSSPFEVLTDPDAADRLSGILTGELPLSDSDPLDAALVECARAERVHLLLADRVGLSTRGSSADPTGVIDGLLGASRAAAADDAARTRELVRVVGRLADAGCSPIVFKGAALAHTHYRRPWLRPRLDTDVLVDPDHKAVAAGVFAALGYTRPAFVSGRLVMYQEMFVRAEAGGLEHVFDVHWRVANPQVVSGVLSHAELDARAVRVTVTGGHIRVPCPVDALLLACVHRAAHHHDSREWLWLYDIHLLARGLSEEDWRDLVALARSRRVAALGARGLALAASRFGTPVPDFATGAWATDGGEPSAVFLRDGLRPLARLRSDLAALGLADRLRLLRELVVPPPSYMRSAYGESAWLPWQYVRRVVTGARKWTRPVARNRHARE
ncbi:MAG TPA: nucleotidyltransferase family protein [Vicinamibacterales bacterium]